LGIHLDQEANRAPDHSDRVISLPCSRVALMVIHTNEELIVARETAKVLAST
jgi:acetate kinase